MTEKVEVVITADDKASSVFKSLGSNVAKFGKIAAGVALAGVLALSAAFGAFAINAIKSAGEVEETTSKLFATFGEETDALVDSISEFADITGRSRFELQEQVANLGAVTKALGANEEQAALMSRTMVGLAVDVGSFNNLPSEEVARKFTSALTGEFESLKSLGIVINQASLNQELLNMGVAGGTKAASAYEKALAVQALILAQTSDAQGDAARTSRSFTNQMIAAKSKMSDFATEIGLKLLPVVTPLIEAFGIFADRVLPKVSAAFEEKLLPILSGASRILDTIIATGFGSIEMWETLGGVVGEELAGKIRAVVEGFQEFATNTQEVISGLVARFKDEFIPKLQEVAQAFADWFAANFTESLAATGENIRNILDNIKLFWEQNKEAIMGIVGGLILGVVTIFTSGLQLLSGIVSAAMMLITGDFEGAQATIIETFNIFAETILGVMGTNLEEFRAQWETNWDLFITILSLANTRIVEIFTGMVDSVKDVGTNIAEGIKTGFQDAWAGVLATIQDLVNQIPIGIRDLLGIASDSKVTIAIGKFTARGLGAGFAAQGPALAGAVAGTVRRDFISPIARGATTAPITGGGGGGGGTVTIVNRPILSTGDESRLTDALRPIIRNIMRGG